ncbi:hypothetical protein AAMO2058_001555300 [Amorphochlora amoebiformis]
MASDDVKSPRKNRCVVTFSLPEDDGASHPLLTTEGDAIGSKPSLSDIPSKSSAIGQPPSEPPPRNDFDSLAPPHPSVLYDSRDRRNRHTRHRGSSVDDEDSPWADTSPGDPPGGRGREAKGASGAGKVSSGTSGLISDEKLHNPVQNWDDEFQRALETENWEKLHQVAIDFVETATLYGKIVILEQFLPDSQRTVKVDRVGGWAGGTKFIVRGIMFKLATDPLLPAPPTPEGQPNKSQKYLYGGEGGPSHEFAAKSASHELKGANQMFRCGWDRLTRLRASTPGDVLTRVGLRVPMMVMLDYCGFRVTARPWLTLSKDSFLYGYDSKKGYIYIYIYIYSCIYI